MYDRAPLRAAMARYRKAKQRLKEAEEERDLQIIVALARGMPQVLVCEDTGLSREWVRRIAKPKEGGQS